MSETITLEGPSELRKREIEERLEKVALDGLINIYHAITGKNCERYVALGMATSAVSRLQVEHDFLRDRCTELEAALRETVALIESDDELAKVVSEPKVLQQARAALKLAGETK